MKKFTTEVKTELSKEDLAIVRNLYTPFLGMESVLLYHMFLDYHELSEKHASYYLFRDIATTMGIRMEDLYIARGKLEAVGLIRTFEKADNNHFIILINKPLSPEKLRINKLLFSEVIKKISLEMYERVEYHFKKVTFDKSDFKDVSIKYQDLFDSRIHQNNKQSENTINLPTVSLDSIDDAKKGLTAAQFINFLSKKRTNSHMLDVINQIGNFGFSSNAINEISHYSYEINGKIVPNHISTIARDMLKKGIVKSSDIANELSDAKKSRFQPSPLTDKKPEHHEIKIVQSPLVSIKKPEEVKEEVNETQLEWDDVMNSLGEL